MITMYSTRKRLRFPRFKQLRPFKYEVYTIFKATKWHKNSTATHRATLQFTADRRSTKNTQQKLLFFALNTIDICILQML